MFVPMFRPDCFNPIAPSVTPFVPQPMVCRPLPFLSMPAPMPAFTPCPMPIATPFMYSANIFVQNMLNMAASFAATLRQQQQMYVAMSAKYTVPQTQPFGSITASQRHNQYNNNNWSRSNSWNININPSLGGSSNRDISFWERMGYCATSGVRLARTALSRAVGFTGYCARYVKNAIASAGLGPHVSGNACDMVNILRHNRNFREIPVAGLNLNSLPAGCILVYGRGVAGYSARYGHTEITTGDRRAVSDGITNNIRGNVTAVFMPVA